MSRKNVKAASTRRDSLLDWNDATHPSSFSRSSLPSNGSTHSTRLLRGRPHWRLSTDQLAGGWNRDIVVAIFGYTVRDANGGVAVSGTVEETKKYVAACRQNGKNHFFQTRQWLRVRSTQSQCLAHEISEGMREYGSVIVWPRSTDPQVQKRLQAASRSRTQSSQISLSLIPTHDGIISPFYLSCSGFPGACCPVNSAAHDLQLFRPCIASLRSGCIHRCVNRAILEDGYPRWISGARRCSVARFVAGIK